ncbi:LysR family transcriptional regulator [Pigmentiphaga sp.]|uniref:LysR family transcriptional regulator n=1 Tax=Pigmentiphaga sp. TaxID=1977564 RepID=UPI0025F2C37B|nr:LysR family transcriptional regulator [Pigmentiphaga sp.]
MNEAATSTLGTVEMFCAAARAGSFTAAAAVLGTTPSAISKAVRRLEDRLGVKLFARTTRAIRLTDDGQAYYHTCSQALENIHDIERSLTGHRLPRGELRISSPASYGIKRLIPLVPRYVARHHGQVKVTVSVSNAVADFVMDDVDMAIRIGEVADSRLVARQLCAACPCIVASPTYLRRHGTPEVPGDLASHACLGLIMPDSGRAMPWTFAPSADGTATQVRLQTVMNVDHPLGALAAALSDAGLAQLLDFTVEDDLRSGRLVEVLAPWRPQAQPVSAVWPGNRHVPATVRSFVDFLVDTSHP